MKHLINPINMAYKYQFVKETYKGESDYTVNREAADPSIIRFKGQYYLFPSMTAGFLISQDLTSWDFYDYKGNIPVGDYAPDVRVIDGYIYFSASRRESNCSFYRTKDPINEAFEEIEGTFPFWDPNLFVDDDGRLYFYWGCTNFDPIWGVELDKETMIPIGEPQAMYNSDKTTIGYERIGDNHIPPQSPEEIAAQVEAMAQGMMQMPEEQRLAQGITSLEMAKAAVGRFINDNPYIEGAWMTKHDGKYYLQYAIPGTQYNIYGDGVYVADKPLGPYKLAKNNPYSYKPGGFINGAGHGSTFDDGQGNYWHTSTASISVNASFERRLGIWKAGFDSDGELFCDQNYGDWPINIDAPAFTDPDWMLLSYKKPVQVSSGTNSAAITNENVRDWWQAGSSDQAPVVTLDLGQDYDVHTIQINFADSKMQFNPDENLPIYRTDHNERVIDTRPLQTQWLLEGSNDGNSYFVIEDKREAQTDLSHDALIFEEAHKLRYLRLTITKVPYDQAPALSGLRVFGVAEGEYPTQAHDVVAVLPSPLDMTVTWQAEQALGANVLWGFAPDKLYHSYLVMDQNEVSIGALIKDQPVYIRVDTFNEVGITKGEVQPVIV